MIRLMTMAALIMLAGCADRSKGAALSACRLKYFLDSEDAQAQLIADCMRARSFHTVVPCSPALDDTEWDAQVNAYGYDNAVCYRPLGVSAWVASALSPM